jgi:cytoplasmic iron level regulating protein YaaA (DUF328/UPF0246 family)
MIILLSPSKTMNFIEVSLSIKPTIPFFAKEADKLMHRLLPFSATEIARLEHLSARLAYATYESIQRFFVPDQSSKAALFAYTGTVFDKLDPVSFTVEQQTFAERHLRIFSALYGCLRPFDAIRPYRLDMNSGLIDDLYAFWRERVTPMLMNTIKSDDGILINLASAEYSHIVDDHKISTSIQIITPIFKQEKHGKLVSNSFYAKEARGLMTRYIIENQLTNPDYIKAFMDQGYAFSNGLSDSHEWVFVR